MTHLWRMWGRIEPGRSCHIQCIRHLDRRHQHLSGAVRKQRTTDREQAHVGERDEDREIGRGTLGIGDSSAWVFFVSLVRARARVDLALPRRVHVAEIAGDVTHIRRRGNVVRRVYCTSGIDHRLMLSCG
jgi:hypothetical protein